MAKQKASITQNLRVALFSGNYNYHIDGANKALNRLVGFLEQRDIPVLVFSPVRQKPAFAHKGTLIPVPSMPIPTRSEYRLSFPMNAALKARVRAFAPTLIHLSVPDPLGFSALGLAKELGVPAVASFHTRFDTYLRYYGLSWTAPIGRAIMRKFYRHCLHVYVPTPSIGDVLQRQGIVGDNLRQWSRGVDRTLYNPARRDMKWRQSLDIATDDIVVTFVGRLVREKGLDQYVRLIRSLYSQGLPVRAMVVGDGPLRNKVRTCLPDAILTGHLNGEALACAYASSDIYINPSLTETFGNVTLEAMASGVATLCLDATGSSSLIQHGKTGLLIDPDDPAALTRAVAGLFHDQSLRKSLAQGARCSSSCYDWESVTETLLGHYLDLVKRPLCQSRPYAA